MGVVDILIEDARIEGRIEGRVEGIIEGRLKGKKIGIKKVEKKVIKNARLKGFSIKIIAKIVKISTKKVAKILRSMDLN